MSTNPDDMHLMPFAVCGEIILMLLPKNLRVEKYVEISEVLKRICAVSALEAHKEGR